MQVDPVLDGGPKSTHSEPCTQSEYFCDDEMNPVRPVAKPMGNKARRFFDIYTCYTPRSDRGVNERHKLHTYQ